MPSSHACAFLYILFAKHPKSEEQQCVHICSRKDTQKKKPPKSERNLKQNTSFHIYTYKKKVIYLEKHIDFLHSSLTTQNTPIPIKTLIITNTNN